MIALLLAVTLAIAPWTGKDLSTTTSAAVKYRLTVGGVPNAAVHLRAEGVAAGWIAAFCTPQYCSPQRVDAKLPASGKLVFAFELIRESDSASKKTTVTIESSDGATITLAR